ncbi:MAG: carotenoid oxygenase family protein [Bdellovibrio sp.]
MPELSKIFAQKTGNSSRKIRRNELSELFVRSTKAVEIEEDVTLKIIEGSVPKSLNGVLYRNGPGRFFVGHDKYIHPFDGDGMVSKFVFDGAELRYQNKYVRTREFDAEQLAGRMLFRAFGTNLPGGIAKNALKTRFKNAANTNVILHGDNLLALWEGGWPHKLDPKTLQTEERFSFSGRLKNDFGWIDSTLNPELPFSAHPKIDPATGILYNFGTAFGLKNRLIFYAIDSSGQCISRRHFDLNGLSFIHDFLITSQGMAIFFCAPVRFDILSMISGLTTPAAGLSSVNQNLVKVVMFPLSGADGPITDSELRTYDLPFSFVFHHINAYETENEIITYAAEMNDLPQAQQVRNALAGQEVTYPTTKLVKYVFSKDTDRVIRNSLNYSHFELPRVRDDLIGKKFTEFYAAAAGDQREFPFLTCIDKISIQGERIARADFSGCLVGEPVFISSSKSKTNFISVITFNGMTDKSELVLLDAEHLQMAMRAELPYSQPQGFHGNWYRS